MPKYSTSNHYYTSRIYPDTAVLAVVDNNKEVVIGDSEAVVLVNVLIDMDKVVACGKYKWMYNRHNGLVTAYVPNSLDRICLQTYICSMHQAYVGLRWTQITMRHPQDFRIASMSPRFNQSPPLDLSKEFFIEQDTAKVIRSFADFTRKE